MPSEELELIWKVWQEGLQKIQDDTGPLGEKVGVINGALQQLHGGLSSVDSHLVAIAKVLKLV